MKINPNDYYIENSPNWCRVTPWTHILQGNKIVDSVTERRHTSGILHEGILGRRLPRLLEGLDGRYYLRVEVDLVAEEDHRSEQTPPMEIVRHGLHDHTDLQRRLLPLSSFTP